MMTAMRPTILATALCSAMATPVSAAEDRDPAEDGRQLAQMRAELAALASRVAELEGELAQARQEAGSSEAATADTAAEESGTTIAWKGAPEITGEGGWSFKPRGRLQFDAGFVDVPDATGREDGFGSEVRRARLGVSGDIPGGFGYKFELDFAGNEVEAADAYLSYGDGPIEVIVGQHNTFQSLEELTSSLHTSFIERAAFTDAFGFERRLGASVSYARGIALVQAGVFTDNLPDTDSDNRGVDGRLVLMPQIGETQLHFGGSIHYNRIGDPAAVEYRQRPFVHFVSDRFVDTGDLDAESEFGLGLEAAAIAGPFHAAAETFWQSVNRPLGASDPTFFGGYAEIGYFLTRGDTRGYADGTFDRVKPANPVGEGGIGSLQLNLRYDYLDLNDAGIIGGVQNGYLAALVWKPTDYTLLSLNYGRMDYDDAAFPAAGGDTSYTVDAVGVWAQVDF